MDQQQYLRIFEMAAGKLAKKKFDQQQLVIATGIVLNAVYLKIYKKAWSSDVDAPLQATSRIFFSAWVNEESLAKGKILYNIHALKLRQLKGYAIASREFADAFRKRFKPFQKDWENVSTAFGPLTLMEGWVKWDADKIPNTVAQLANNFLHIAHLLDDTLALFAQQ